MKKINFTAVGMIVLAALATASQAATNTWDDGAADDYWSSATNWVDDVAPTNGDSVVLTATAQSRLDYSWTIVSNQSLTTTAPDYGDELVLQSNSVLTLATGGTMDIGFMRPRYSSGGQFMIEPGATLNTDNYGLGSVSATVTFIADAAGVLMWNNANDFNGGLDHLVVDLSGYNISNGTTLVLVNYDGTLNSEFASLSLSAGWAADIDYTYDLGGGDLVIALTNVTQIATVTWDDGAGDDNWSSDTNWVDDVAPTDGDSVVLTVTAQSRLDYSWTIENGRSLTTTASGFDDELVLQSDSVLTLATGGSMDIGFMRPRYSSGGQFIIEPGATLDTDNYGLSAVSATVTFIADDSGVTTWNNTGQFHMGLDSLVVDLSSYNMSNGTTLVLVDYNLAGDLAGQTFASTNLTADWSGTIDYAYDQGGGDLAIALVNIAFGADPETSNGTPHSWLDLYGLVTGGDYEAADLLDSDGDGRLNWEEYQDGTNPTGTEFTPVTFVAAPTNGVADVLDFAPPDTPWVIEATTDGTTWGVVPLMTFVVNPDGSITATIEEIRALAGGGTYRVIEKQKNDKLTIFLTEGQSNMVGSSTRADANSVGYGMRDYPLQNMFQMSHGLSRVLYDIGVSNELIHAFQPLQETFRQGSYGTDDAPFVALDFYFARAYAEDHPDEDVLIIKNARGGTGFANDWWNEGDPLDAKVTEFFADAFAENDLSNRYESIEFGGILWHQGEADSGSTNSVAAYSTNLVSLVARHRSRVANYITNSAPFILGTVHYYLIENPTAPYAYMDDIDAIHRTMPGLIADCGLVDLFDLRETTSIHFKINEYKIAGARYYDKWLEVTTGGVVWDGEGADDSWTTATNWSGDVVPVLADDVTVGAGASVTNGQSEFGSLSVLPSAWVSFSEALSSNVITNAGTIDYPGVFQLGDCVVDMADTGRLGTNITRLDTDGSEINFNDGVVFLHPAMDFEHKGENTFGFELSVDGFTTLQAGALVSGGGAAWSNATFNIDLSGYGISNGTTVVLADYASHDAAFDGSFNPTVNILAGSSGLNASLSFDTNASQLVLTFDSAPVYGTPTSWLDLYGLVIGGDYAGAEIVDSDGDGRLNWEEYQDGTNPTGGVSVAEVDIVFFGGTNEAPDTLAFDPPDEPWIVEISTNLSVGDWGVVPMVPFLTASNGSVTASALHEASNPERYYRLAEPRINDTVVIFLAEGQSNMQGGSSDAATNIYDVEDLPLRNMFQLSRGHARDFYDPGMENEIIRSYQPHQTTHTSASYETRAYTSLDFYFAREYAKDNPDHDVLMVKNAQGGTGFRNNFWNAGDSLDLLVTPYMETAANLVTSLYSTVRFGGILWHQGEADANAADLYETNLVSLVARHRGFVEAEITNSAAPFICGTMVSRWMEERTSNYVVNAVHTNIANLVTNAACADLSDLDQEGWPLTNHFLTDELKVAGRRYYLKWLDVAAAMGW